MKWRSLNFGAKPKPAKQTSVMVVMIAMIGQMKMDVQQRLLWFVQKKCFAVMETAYKVICNVMEKTIVQMDPMRKDVLRRSSPPRLVEQMRQKEVKLICNVSDAKNYIWYTDERKIHLPSDRYFVKSHWYLQITDVFKSDSGTFVYLASSSYGKLNCTVRLIVEDPTASPTNVLGDEKTRDALVPGIVSAGVLITVAALSFICWRRRSRTKEPVNGPISVSELEFEYDAFVIFSSQDSDWVTKTLILTLEEKHGLKCCVHYRDFVAGVPFRENMVNSVYKSRKTIAVVSNNFFNSNYCGFEMDYALHRLMERRDNSLVAIKLDDVDRGKLPKELRERSFIDLSKNIEKEHWERKLVKCLTIPSDLSQEQIM
ncbi:unnamed protein product [Pocillopora meandrina]|uniref:TIR domain-containing protein n=1 Tax=Pocillopora meandrina TaxID=46732 RepID=A0AAU9XA15_9CNID|nr:unnamed protein product [Pocillopora meandrina]